MILNLSKYLFPSQYDPYVHVKPQAVSRKASPQVDIFEVARHKGSVAVRREPINHQVADEFNNLRNRGLSPLILVHGFIFYSGF